MSADLYLRTARARLRQLHDGDVENLVELNSDPEVMRYLGGGPAPREEAEMGVARTKMYRERYGGRLGVFSAELTETGAFMGWFHLRPDRKNLDDVKNLELGYRLKKEFWDKGYATEVSLALIAKAFDELGADSVFAVTDAENAASRRVMEKCGLAFEREYVDPEWNRRTVRYSVAGKDRRRPSGG
jgi:RimJ/RimL family protein N-acetyltransferase